MATYPTPAQIDAAVPVNGEPSRALTNAALKALAEAPTAANISDATAVGRSVLTAATAAAARTAIGAGTSSLAIGTTATTAAAGNHTHSAATASAAGFMTAAQFSKLAAMPAFRLVESPPETPTDPGEMWDIALTSDALFICVAENEWRQVTLTSWGV